MEYEATIQETETAISDDNAVDRIAALLDMPEASDDSEQATVEHVEDQPLAEETDAIETQDDAEEAYYEIDGEQVSLSELRNGYLRQSAFTRKTQELAEQRKTYEAAMFDKQALRQEALQGIEMLKQQLAADFAVLEQPNWDELLRDDPHEYLLQQQKWARREQSVKQLYDAEQAVRREAAAFEDQQHENQLREHKAKFFEKYPELHDNTKAQEALGSVTSLLIDGGFTREEIEGVSDFRIISLLYEASKAINAQKAIPAVVQKMEQRPTISVKGNSSKASDAYTRDYDTFNKTRKGDDAIALISRLL